MKGLFFNKNRRRISILSALLYLLAAALYCAQAFFPSELLRALKAVPFAVLIALLLAQDRTWPTLRIAAGVFFGAVGDLLLEYGDENLFNFGAAAFLVGHIFYNVSMLSHWGSLQPSRLFKNRFLFFGGAVAASAATGAVAVWSLSSADSLSRSLMPVYAAFLTFDLVNSLLLLCGRGCGLGEVVLLVGTASFLVSDCSLASSRFGGMRVGGSSELTSLLIMGTYYLGQVLIVQGLSALEASRDQPRHSESLLEAE